VQAGSGWTRPRAVRGRGHIPLACTPDPYSAAPITGALEKCEVEFEHRMKVTRIWEAPRVTKPYSEEQWSEIDRLGHAIDAQLKAMDVRLTQGGEPTFVSVDDPDGAEWNTEALGPTKRLLAADLFHRMRDRYGAGGLVHFGQGKWYPGEQLPRWSLNCFWRKDGEPVWKDPAAHDAAQRFAERVAERIGVKQRLSYPRLRRPPLLALERRHNAGQSRPRSGESERQHGAARTGKSIDPWA
jgi:hypothetical protein